MIKPKSYSDVIKQTIEQVTSSTNISDLNTGSAIDALSKAIEAGLYGGYPLHERELRILLNKLGIKSALPAGGGFGSLIGGGPLKMESLEATLKSVTFDDTSLKKWRPK